MAKKSKEEERWLKEGAQRRQTNVNKANKSAATFSAVTPTGVVSQAQKNGTVSANKSSNKSLNKNSNKTGPASRSSFRALGADSPLSTLQRAAQERRTGYTAAEKTAGLSSATRNAIARAAKERQAARAKELQDKLAKTTDRRAQAAYRQELRDALYPLTSQEKRMSWRDRDQLQKFKENYAAGTELIRRGQTALGKQMQESAHRGAEWLRAGYGFSGGESGADNVLPELSDDEFRMMTPAGQQNLRAYKRLYELAEEMGDQELMGWSHEAADDLRLAPGTWDREKVRAWRDRDPDYQFYDAHGRSRYTPSELDAAGQAAFLPAIGNSILGSFQALGETARQATRNSIANQNNKTYQSAMQNIQTAKEMLAQAKTQAERDRAQKLLEESMALAEATKTDDAVSKFSPGMWRMHRANELSQDVINMMDTKGGQLLAQAALSMGQMAPALALAPFTGGAAPLAIMGAQAAGAKTADLAWGDVGASEALARGLVSGGIEALTEKIPLDNLLGIVRGAGGPAFLKSVAKQSGIEATEESASYILNYAADVAAQDPDAAFSLQELAESAAVGAISGAGFGAGGALLGSVNQPARARETDGGGVTAPPPSPVSAEDALRQAAEEMAVPARTDVSAPQEAASAAPGMRAGTREGTFTRKAKTTSQGAVVAPASQTKAAAPQAARQTEMPPAVQQAPRQAAVQTRQPGSAFGENGQKAYQAVFEGKASPEQYAGFAAFYQAGVSGSGMDRAQRLYSGSVGREQAFAAYSAGQNDARVSLEREKAAAPYAKVAGDDAGLVYDDYVENTLDRDVSARVNTVAKALGVRVRFAGSVAGGMANAQISGSEILVERDNENPVLFLLGHEWTHRMQEVAPEEYRAFRNAVTPELESQVESRMALYASRGVDLSYEEAMDEVTADYAGRMVQDGALLDSFIRKNSGKRSLLERVREAIRALRIKLKGTAEEKLALEAEKKLTRALEASTENVSGLKAGAQNDTMGATRYSLHGKRQVKLSRQEATQIQSARMAKYHTFRKAMPDIDYLFAHDMFYLIENRGDDGFRVIQRLDPAKKQGYIDAILEEFRHETVPKRKRTDTASEERGSRGAGRGRDHAPAGDRGADQRNAGLDARAEAEDGKRVPGEGDGDRGGVTPRFSIKMDSQGRKLTQGQQDYFRDSKAVDVNGNLRVLYHGTGADFTVFDAGRIEQNFQNRGGDLGFYFAPFREDAQGYASNAGGGVGKGKIMEVYLNLKNPLIVEDDGWGDAIRQADLRHGDLKRWADVGGHDGIIVKSTDIDMGDGEVDAVYIAFSPEQIKSVDNLNPTEDPDIRFSLKGASVDREMADLLKENELLHERVAYWKGQLKRTEKATVDKGAVRRAAKSLVEGWDSTLGVNDIVDDLQGLYDYLTGDPDAGYTTARERAEEIGKRLVESSLVKMDGLYKEYANLRKFLRETRITVSEADAAGIADFNDFRKANFGRMNLGKGKTNVDQVYQELEVNWPEWFDEARESTVVDQINHIADVMEKIYTIQEENPFSAEMQKATAGAANEIMELFFDLPQTKATYADKAARKLDQEKARGRAQVQKVREQRDQQLAALRAKNRKKVQETLEKERARRERDLSKLKATYEARTAAGRDRQNRRELMAKIQRHTKALSQKLVRPTDKQHIPEGLRGPVAALLEAINLESQYSIDPATGKRTKGAGDPTKRTQAFLQLKEQYAKIVQEGGDMVIDPALLGDAAEGFQGSFDAVIALGDTKLADMTVAQLETVWRVVKAVEHSVSTAGKILSQAKFRSTVDWANAMAEDTKSRRKKRSLTMDHKLLDLETPYTFFSHYGDSGMAVYRLLRNAQDRQQVMMDQVEQAVATIVSPKQVKKLEETLHDFTTERGDKLTLSTAHIMELHELTKRQQAHDHLLEGGIVQPEIKSKRIRRGTESILLTQQDLMDMVSSLSNEEAKIADDLQKLTTSLLAKFGNEAAMQAYGFQKFTGADYWPIKTAAEGRRTDVEKGGNQSRNIKNVGMAKAIIPNASNPLDLGGVFTTFANHTSDMVDYAAWLVPMEDLNRLYNFRFRDDEGNQTGKTIKGLLDRVGGEGSQKYWLDLMGDIQNGIGAKNDTGLGRLFSSFVGNAKGASVGANLRVVIQQPTAYVRALVALNPADLTLGITTGATRGSGWKKALKWAPIARRKDVGSFDISNPMTAKESLFDNRTKLRKFNDAMGVGSKAADAMTWGKLWNACEHATARQRKDLAKGSDEFYQAVAEKFTDVIDQTQVVDGVLQRSHIMRSGNAVTQQATSFMGEPIMGLNLVMRAYDKVRYEQDAKKRSKAIKGLGAATVTFLAAASANAVAQSIIDAMRDDDDEKKYLDRAIAAFTGLRGDEAGAVDKIRAAALEGNLAGNLNPLGAIPYVSDLLSIVQGYDVERLDMSVWAALLSAGETFIDSMSGEGRKTPEYAFKQLTTAASKIFGISAMNILRDVWGAMRSVAIEREDLLNQYRMDRRIYNIANTGNRSRYVGLAFRALTAGDMDTYYLIREELMDSQGLGGKELDSALRSAYNDAMEDDPDFTMAQDARDLIGLGDEYYVPEEEEEDEFSEDSLSAAEHKRFSKDRADSYRQTADALESYDAFSKLDNEDKNKLLASAYKLARTEALAEHSGGKYQMDTKWMIWAAGGEEHGVEPAEAILFKLAYDMTEGDKDENGKTINGTKKKNVLEAAAEMMPWLTQEEIAYLKTNYNWK